MNHLDQLLAQRPATPPASLSPQNPQGPIFRLTDTQLGAPTAVYISPQDSIQLVVTNPLFDFTVQVHYRVLAPNGAVTPNVASFASHQTGAGSNIFTLPPSEGFLLSMTVQSTAAARGQCFVKVFLIAGSNSDGTPLDHLLIQGYVSTNDRQGFPQSQTESSLSGQGWPHSLPVGDGTLGNPFTITVSTGVRWGVFALSFDFVASGVAANRFVRVVLLDTGGNFIAAYPLNSVIIAGETWHVTCGPDLQAMNLNHRATVAIPQDMIVAGGWKFTLAADNMDAGDQFKNIVIAAEEWVGA